MKLGVFETWLKKLNCKMAFEQKDIVILGQCVITSNSWVKQHETPILSTNTTSVLQPMDQGIIQVTKWKFRKLQLQNMITVMKIHKEKCALEILKKIDVLQVITWIKKA